MQNDAHHTALSALLRARPAERAPDPEPAHAPIDLQPASIRPVRRLRRRWLPWLLFGAALGCTQAPSAKLGEAPTRADQAVEAALVDTVADAIRPASTRGAPPPRS